MSKIILPGKHDLILNPNDEPGIVSAEGSKASYEKEDTNPPVWNVQFMTTPISATNRKLSAKWTLEQCQGGYTFKCKGKKFGIFKKNKRLANKLAKGKMQLWIQYLQYEKDDGIRELARFLAGMKFKESYSDVMTSFHGADIEKELTKALAEEIANERDKDLVTRIENSNTDINEFFKKWQDLAKEQNDGKK